MMKKNSIDLRNEIGGYVDLTGKTIGNLTVLRFLRRDKGNAVYEVRCKCGHIKEAKHGSITQNKGGTCRCPKTVTAPTKPKTTSFEFRIETVKQCIVDLREDKTQYKLDSSNYHNKGIQSRRNMTEWRKAIEVIEDNILFRILDMIEEVQRELTRKGNN